ncbi:MAG TPA: threonine synthase, partial [Firmicutes bacterium]|nr:threonine synthase [Bacillota bacterium]
MHYVSSRGDTGPVSAAEAILKGIAPDGGLFVPSHLPRVDYIPLMDRGYPERAGAILSLFLGQLGAEQIRAWTRSTYSPSRFDCPPVAPLIRLDRGLYILELWHGPTGAFKDLALQLLPYLLTGSMKQDRNQAPIIAILVATSGDTGKAALEGFCNVPGTRIVVFYPEQGVSEVQKRQMVTQQGENVEVLAVRGNFDDTQTGVKAIFADQAIAKKLA